MAITEKQLRVAAKAIGRRIAALRREAGLTQEDLAERVGSTKATISRLETGAEMASVQRLAEIADAVGVDLPQLFVEASVREDECEAAIASVVALLRGRNLSDVRRARSVLAAMFDRT